MVFFFFFQAEDGIRDADVTGVQTCALPISSLPAVSNASPAETSVINVTVENQVTPYGYPLFGKYFRVRGSEARAVFVSITLPPSLAQVGNITATGGFECGISLSGNTV